MARSTLCSKCKCEKEPGRENESYCKKCKHSKRAEARAKARAERGWRPIGSGPNPNCIDCGLIKQDINQSYCNECRSLRNKEWSLRTGRVKKNRTGLCPCGAERAPNQPYFCQKCKTEDSRRYRALKGITEKSREVSRAYYHKNKIKIKKRIEEDFLFNLKRTARATTNNAILSGILQRQPCEICGGLKVEAHHDDYNKPLEVRWLCIKHHKEHHRNELAKLKGT